MASQNAETNKENPREDFHRFLRFGLIDSSLLIGSLLFGFSIDAVIARRVGVKGYGPLVGAGIGNAVSDFLAGLPEGTAPAFGVGLGAIIPILPVFGSLALRKELSGRTAYVVAGSSGVLFGASYSLSYWSSHYAHRPAQKTQHNIESKKT